MTKLKKHTKSSKEAHKKGLGGVVSPDLFNTLAQLRTIGGKAAESLKCAKADKNEIVQIPEDYKESISRKTLQNRARSKAFNDYLVFSLSKLESPLKKSYINTYWCSRVLIQEGQTLRTKYCGNRWCFICNRIRTAKLIQAYEASIRSMENAYFVTLTIKNCSGEKLKDTIQDMLKAFTRIKDNLRKRYNLKLNGIRKFECTYNPITNEYHPHFHFILDGGREAANLVVKLWRKQFPFSSSKDAQDIRPVNEGSTKELFKYFTKLLFGKEKKLYPKALDTIFQAMRGLRVFQNFGYVMPEKLESEQEDLEEVQPLTKNRYHDIGSTPDMQYWTWKPKLYDWEHVNTGEVLSLFIPDQTDLEKIKKLRAGALDVPGA